MVSKRIQLFGMKPVEGDFVLVKTDKEENQASSLEIPDDDGKQFILIIFKHGGLFKVDIRKYSLNLLGHCYREAESIISHIEFL